MFKVQGVARGPTTSRPTHDRGAPPRVKTYSVRIAVIGSMRVALKAGT